jgi:outer membrane protein assembly factor BamB
MGSYTTNFSVLLALAVTAVTHAQSEPAGGLPVQWSSNPSRNMVLPAKGLPGALDAKNLLFEFDGGRYLFGSPVTDGRRLLVVGDAKTLTSERLKAVADTRSGAMVCLDLRTGKVLWELVTPKFVGDDGHWKFGICSTPVIEGDRCYIVGAGGNVLCLDMAGQANGNDGPFVGEREFMSAKPGTALKELQATDADILWRLDIRKETGALFHDAYCCTPLIQDGNLWVTTNHRVGSKLPEHLQPAATRKVGAKLRRYVGKDIPNLLVLDKRTGRLLARDRTKVEICFHGAWSSPSMGVVNGRPLVFWGDGYGVLHAYRPPGPSADGRLQDLVEVWKADVNPPEFRRDSSGKAYPYPTGAWKPGSSWKGTVGEFRMAQLRGPCPVIGTPVFHDGKVYVAIGRDVNEGRGGGAVTCLDPTGSGDISASGIVWVNKDVGKSMNTLAVSGGMVFVGDTNGALSCLDVGTGKTLWQAALGGPVEYCSPMVADGKVYVTTNNGKHFIFQADRQKQLLWSGKIGGANSSSATAVDGILVVPTGRTIRVYGKADGPQPALPQEKPR